MDLDYLINNRDRLSQKYIYQTNPVTAPFGGGSTLGFPKAVSSGTQTGALDNSTIITPSLTWEQKVGVNRQYNYSSTGQPFTATFRRNQCVRQHSVPGPEHHALRADPHHSERLQHRAERQFRQYRVLSESGNWFLDHV